MHALADLVLANLQGWTAGGADAEREMTRLRALAMGAKALKPMRLLLVWIINALSLLALPYLFSGIQVEELLHGADRRAPARPRECRGRAPSSILLTLPLTVLTLGLFIFVINGLLFWFVASFVDGFVVAGFWMAVLRRDRLQRHQLGVQRADPGREEGLALPGSRRHAGSKQLKSEQRLTAATCPLKSTGTAQYASS